MNEVVGKRLAGIGLYSISIGLTMVVTSGAFSEKPWFEGYFGISFAIFIFGAIATVIGQWMFYKAAEASGLKESMDNSGKIMLAGFMVISVINPVIIGLFPHAVIPYVILGVLGMIMMVTGMIIHNRNIEEFGQSAEIH